MDEPIKAGEGEATLQAAINEYFPYLTSFFGGSKSRNNEIFRKWNIKQRTNDEMRQDFMKRATEVTTKYGLTLPEVRQAAGGWPSPVAHASGRALRALLRMRRTSSCGSRGAAHSKGTP